MAPARRYFTHKRRKSNRRIAVVQSAQNLVIDKCLTFAFPRRGWRTVINRWILRASKDEVLTSVSISASLRRTFVDVRAVQLD